MNITGLDHLVILASDGDKAFVDYTTLFGREPDWRHANQTDGTVTSIFCVENTKVELLAPYGSGPVGDRIRELVGDKDGCLSSLAFSVSNIDESHHIAYRRGLDPDDITRMGVSNGLLNRQWSRFRCDDQVLSGLKVFLLQEHSDPLVSKLPAADGVGALDHMVITTFNPDKALATYGARLGFSLALDRASPDWGARFLFFRVPGTVFEVVQRLDGKASDVDKPDELSGVSWRVQDIAAAYNRLKAAGVDVSEVRKGRKPGTHVMTVKSHTLGVPTLFLSEEN